MASHNSGMSNLGAAAAALSQRCGCTVTRVATSEELMNCPNCGGVVAVVQEEFGTPPSSPLINPIIYPDDFFMRTSDSDSDNDIPGHLLPPPPPPPFLLTLGASSRSRNSDFYTYPGVSIVEDEDELPSVRMTEGLMASYSCSPCAVCLNSFEVNEVVKKTPCNHAFHSDCILPWLQSHTTCPVCRSPLHHRS